MKIMKVVKEKCGDCTRSVQRIQFVFTSFMSFMVPSDSASAVQQSEVPFSYS
jgi:hypothetical protein